MSSRETTLRVATYNVHKCRGFDRKTSPQRIAEVLHEIDADILCLQEVVDAPAAGAPFDQVNALAAALPRYTHTFGSNRTLHGGGYGNLTLSRLPLGQTENHDLTERREPRGALLTDIALTPALMLHVYNVHLGTGFLERRGQGRRLLGKDVLAHPDRHGSRLVLGDFNEWTRGLSTRLLRDAFQTFQPEHHFRFPRTFPGMLPLFTLDHCYFESPLELVGNEIWRTRTALIASDHLPLVATFRVRTEA